MRKRKKIFCILLSLFILIVSQTFTVWGSEIEWYDLREVNVDSQQIISYDENSITPYARYIMGATVSIVESSSHEVMMRSEVFCTDEMKKITTVFTLQKKSGSKWIDVGEGSVSVSNSTHMYKAMETTGVTSGTYRCIANTMVTSKSGYTESVSVTSGQIVI